MSTKARNGVEAEIDALFRLPLSEFTAARNSLAARLKKAGQAIDAARVKLLAKPSAPAWAVNQVYWQNPQAIHQLIAVVERVRKAQSGRAKNATLRELLDDRKQRLAELMQQAQAILGAGGHAISPDLLRRVSATLEALAVSGKSAGGPRAGRLTADLDPPGFDAFAAMMSGSKSELTNVLAFRKSKPAGPADDAAAARARAREAEDMAIARARAHEAVQAAEKVLREATSEMKRTQTVLAKATARMASIEKQKQEIEARHAEAEEAGRALTDEAKKAERAFEDAERSLTKAKADL